MRPNVTIIGAGLAGSEAALQLAKSGYNVTIFETKPNLLPVYRLSSAAELVCNNSLGEFDVKTPRGKLLSELFEAGSELLTIAKKNALKDCKYFAVDIHAFSQAVSNELANRGVSIINKEITSLPDERPLIIASGPLTNDSLAKSVYANFGIPFRRFSDACCPIIDIKTVDLANPCIFKKSDDLYEILLDGQAFRDFRIALLNGVYQTKKHMDESFFIDNICTIEALMKQGTDAQINARFDRQSNIFKIYLRREAAITNGYILAGCTTMLNNSSQRIAFSGLPGLKNCEYIRYGRMHRNTFFYSPSHLDCFYNIIGTDAYLVGQLTGTDGYLAAISSGYIAAKRIIHRGSLEPFSTSTLMGALAHYVSNLSVTEFQPMGASFNLLSIPDQN